MFSVCFYAIVWNESTMNICLVNNHCSLYELNILSSHIQAKWKYIDKSLEAEQPVPFLSSLFSSSHTTTYVFFQWPEQIAFGWYIYTNISEYMIYFLQQLISQQSGLSSCQYRSSKSVPAMSRLWAFLYLNSPEPLNGAELTAPVDVVANDEFRDGSEDGRKWGEVFVDCSSLIRSGVVTESIKDTMVS